MRKIFTALILTLFVLAISCSSKENLTGRAVAEEPNIYEENSYEDATIIEQNEEPQTTEIIGESIKEQTEVQDNSTEPLETEQTEEIKYIDTENFNFPNTSIVSTQNNISLSLDGYKHEIISEYWGKITEISVTVLNKGNKAFKPRVHVILHDEKDPKEEWFNSKADIDFGIDKLYPDDHISKQAIVNVAFDDITLTKKLELVIVDANEIQQKWGTAHIGGKALVVVETDFTPLQSR